MEEEEEDEEIPFILKEEVEKMLKKLSVNEPAGPRRIENRVL